MPNPNYVYQALDPDSTCIAPINYEHSYFTMAEVLQFSIPSIILFTLWHLFFNATIGEYLAKKAIFLECGEFPPPKPTFVSTEERLSPKKMEKLRSYFEQENKSKTKKRRSTEQKPTQIQVHTSSNTNGHPLQYRSSESQALIRRRFGNNNGAKQRSKPKIKKMLETKILPANQQSTENIAFLCNRKSANDLGYTIDEIRQYRKWMKTCIKGQALRRKFCEESWKCLTMFFVTIYGIHTILAEDYFYDPSLLFTHAYDIPQRESHAVFVYYQIAVGYHVHRAFWQFVEQRRADFIAMFIHHSVTIGLLFASWFYGIMTFGALVMVCHDNADVFLPLAKCCRWLKLDMATNVAYVLFTLLWVASRIVLFSWKVLIPLVMYGYPAFCCHLTHYFAFVFGLFCLLFLHLYWTKFIAPVFFKYLFVKGHHVQDVRSSDSDYDSDIEPHHLRGDSDDGNVAGVQNEDNLKTEVKDQ